MAGDDPSDLSPRALLGLFALFYAVAAVPVLLAGILPLVDYPNHLARMAVLAHLPHDPLLQRYYAAAWHPIPDLAMDALVPPLLGILPLEWAGRLFVLLAFLLLAGGAALLGRALNGRLTAWPFLAFLLVYNRLLLWGLLNYLFGLGLALVALALMVSIARRGVVLRVAAGTVAAFAIYFAHLMAFGVYSVALAGMMATPLRPARDAVPRIAIAVLPLLLPLLLFAASGGEHGITLAFSPPWRKLDLPFSVFDLYHRPFDIACFALFAGGLGYFYWRRWLALAPPLVLPLAALFVLYLALPTQTMGASGIDRRVPLALFLLLVAGTAWTGPRPRVERLVLGAAAAMFLVRTAVVMQSWHASDAVYRADLAALDALPQGSRLAVAAPPDAAEVVATPLFHLPTLAVARQDAFVPTLFAIPGQQPIVLTPAYATLAQESSPDRLWRRFVEGAGDPAASAVLDRYDYIAFTGLKPFALASAPGRLVYGSPRFALYRLGG